MALGAFACAGQANSVLQDLQSLRKLEDSAGVLQGPPDEVRETSHSRRSLQGHSREKKAGRHMADLE